MVQDHVGKPSKIMVLHVNAMEEYENLRLECGEHIERLYSSYCIYMHELTCL